MHGGCRYVYRPFGDEGAFFETLLSEIVNRFF